jgi:uncharacterized protein (TIGR03382 family)
MNRAVLWVSIAVLGWVPAAFASSLGIIGFSTKPSNGSFAACDTCHNGGTAPTVAFGGPASVQAGSKTTYTLTISGGPARRGGAGIAVEGATFSTPPAGSTLKLESSSGELVNAAATPFVGTSLTFTFELVAPATNGTATIYASANSSNGDMLLTGDGTANAKLDVAVTGGSTSAPPATGGGTPTGGSVVQGSPDGGYGGDYLGTTSRTIEGTVDFGCNAASGLPAPLALGLLAFALRRRARRTR